MTTPNQHVEHKPTTSDLSTNTEVTDSINSLAGFEVSRTQLKSALQDLQTDRQNEPQTPTTPNSFDVPTSYGSYHSPGYFHDGQMSFSNSPYEPMAGEDGTPSMAPSAPPPPPPYLPSPGKREQIKDRSDTPKYLVENDDILVGENLLEYGTDSSIEQQAEAFMHRLVLHRNAYIDIHAQLDNTVDYYDFDDINMAAITKKPTNFLVLGKPGVGLTTFAQKFAEKMHLIYISPASAVEYFNPPAKPPENETGDPEAVEFHGLDVGLDDSKVFEFICQRIQVLDVQHRGYILDGWPIIKSEEISVDDQLDMLRLLPAAPDIVFFMQMQDRDLYKRRAEQKLDPMTNQVYTKKQYMRSSIMEATMILDGNSNPANSKLNSRASLITPASQSVTTISSTGLHDRDKAADTRTDLEEEETDFLPLSGEVVGRLISRLEDHPAQVKKDYDKFNQAIPALQNYLNSLNRTKVFELDAYFAPRAIVMNAMKIMDALGIIPAAYPVEIFRPVATVQQNLGPEDAGEEGLFGEGEDEEGCIPDPNDPDSANYKKKDDVPTDWDAVMRAVLVRGRIDPRFRWHISRWKNLCPVALKEGRSIIGRPELAYGFHDKVYFLSNDDAVKKFNFNPRIYLVKSMPTSPVKFFVVGHPLAGKTIFAKELANISGGMVIDMKRQVEKFLEVVKERFIFKTRLESTMEAKKIINKLNFQEWKRMERFRRERIRKWIADYIRRKAAEEVNKALEAEREERMKKYRKWRWESEFHDLSSAFKSSPCNTEHLAFSWKKFVADIKKGTASWTHQQRLELAWELFNAGKLRYKGKPKIVICYRKKPKKGVGDYGEEAEGEEAPGEGEESGEGEDLGESEPGEVEEEEEKKKKRRRRRKRPYCKKPQAEIAVITDDELESSPLSSEEEPDESIRARYPEMCEELTESVPRPADVEDQNEQVQLYVKEKVKEKQTWLETLPSELYDEILQLSIRDAEREFKKKFPDAHMSGGWIIENLILDVDKWRSILRNPALCPDQIFVLQDDSPGFAKITNRLKIMYMAAYPKQGRLSLMHKKLGEILGEGEDAGPAVDVITGDGGILGLIRPEDDEHDPLVAIDDYLRGKLCETPSEHNFLKMDRRRAQSRADPLSTSTDEEEYNTRTPKKSEAKFTLSPVHTHVDLECSHGFKGEKHASISQVAWEKAVPAEMLVILPMTKAIRLAQGYGDVTETEEDPTLSTEFSEEMEEKLSRQMSLRRNTTPNMLEAGEMLGEGDDLIHTPDGLNTPQDFGFNSLCLGPEAEDDPACKPGSRPDTPSLKKAFLKQITNFNDFWNMVYPVLNEQKVSSWEVGLISYSTAPSTAQKFWDMLEARFTLPPKPVTYGEFEEEDADVIESNNMWGGKSGDARNSGEAEEEYGEGGSDDEGDYMERVSSRLRGLENNPDLYRSTLEEIESARLFGDYNYYCPVTLYDQQLIRKGSQKFALRYQDKLYYFVSQAAADRFKENPQKFLPHGPEKCIPPPRICITGAPGCGQEEVAYKMSQRAGVYYFNFRDRLQEIIKARLGEQVGPYYTGEIITQQELPESPFALSRRSTREYHGEVEGEWDEGSEWIKEKNERKFMEELAMESLGLVEKAEVVSYPMNSIDRVETKVQESTKTSGLTSNERHVKAFLETGAQLPFSVLDEFLPALWNEAPFKSRGFVLVGFPNTAKDIQYLTEKNLWPEKVYVMECRKTTCRNRLIREAIKFWKRFGGATRAQPQPRILYPHQRSPESLNRPNEYQELPPSDVSNKIDIWCDGNVVCVRAGKVIHHFHYIFTQAVKAMKFELNRDRIPWVGINTDRSLYDGKLELARQLTPALLYRRNFYETTHLLFNEQAEVLLQNEYFHLSKFKRFCPVEVSRGNQGINLWNAPGIVKYPVLYRNYIYFIAGLKNLHIFRDQVLDMVQQLPPLPSVPFHVVVLGPPKSGKTELAHRLANNLGFLYVQEDEVITRIVKHSLAISFEYDVSTSKEAPEPMAFAQQIHAYLKKGRSIPPYMYYRALDFALLNPLAQYQGCVFDGYPAEDISVQVLLDQGIIPGVIVKLELELDAAQQRCERNRRIPNYNFKAPVEDCDELIKLMYEEYGPAASPCIFWFGDQMQCLFTIDGKKNPAQIFAEVAVRCIAAQTMRQQYILNTINSRSTEE